MRGLLVVAAMAILVALSGFLMPEGVAVGQSCGGTAASCSGSAVAASCSGSVRTAGLLGARRGVVRRVITAPRRIVARVAARTSCGG